MKTDSAYVYFKCNRCGDMIPKAIAYSLHAVCKEGGCKRAGTKMPFKAVMCIDCVKEIFSKRIQK